jgi:hypothetical protein
MKIANSKASGLISRKEQEETDTLTRPAATLSRLAGEGRLRAASLCSMCSLWQILLLFFIAFEAFPSNAQIQQAWVAHYNNGITTGTNQAVKMALDSSGNIYVTGVSQNASSKLGYVTIKYAPNGKQLWATRYDSLQYPSATPAALVLDSSNNVIVTGSALTIKYDANGNQLWTAPYAGSALACDAAGNTYAAGFGTNFNTVKLAPPGSNVWLNTYIDVGPTVSQSVLVDSGNNVYVSGLDSYQWIPESESNPNIGVYAVALTTIKYGSNGSRTWMASQSDPYDDFNVQIAGAALDSSGNFFLLANLLSGPGSAFITYKYTSNGSSLWTSFPDNGTGPANGLALDSNENVLLVGQDAYQYNGSYSYYYSTFKLSSNGSTLWKKKYPQPAFGSSAASSIAVDSVNNSYVTGYSPGTNSGNDIVTIKYGLNGNQIWLQRYHGPGSGNDAGNAIAVDNNGNVYVTGYETTAAGGTEIVTIKYSPVSLQRRADGTVILQAQGTNGESFDIQASADLQSWLDLGSATADTNGLMQFDDTNAPNYPARFYITSPQ